MTAAPDWKAEAVGLGYMIRQIEANYRQAKSLGGDSELLALSIVAAARYVNVSLREILAVEGGESQQ